MILVILFNCSLKLIFKCICKKMVLKYKQFLLFDIYFWDRNGYTWECQEVAWYYNVYTISVATAHSLSISCVSSVLWSWDCHVSYLTYQHIFVIYLMLYVNHESNFNSFVSIHLPLRLTILIYLFLSFTKIFLADLIYTYR